jgi:CubicO group peptidase (beta-lactamase class C family)
MTRRVREAPARDRDPTTAENPSFDGWHPAGHWGKTAGVTDRPEREVPETALTAAQAVVSSGKVPGLAFAVASPMGLEYAGAAGFADLAARRPATVADQYLWFSMTKIATATAAVKLHADGLLDLDAPIGTYLPGYRPHPRYGHPTMRQLLTHSAGLGNPLPVRWVRPEHEQADTDWLSRIVKKHGTPRRPVGTLAVYSNIGYLLAGEVMRAATGRPVEQCVRGLVLDPLGMTATGYSYDAGTPRAVGYVRMAPVLRPVLVRVLPDGVVGPRIGPYTSLQPFLVNGPAYGGLVGTAADASRLAAAHAAAATDPHPVLEQGDIEEMRTISAPGKRFDHGIGWFRRPADATRRPAFAEHYGTGGGFRNAMRIYPDDRIAMVAMANTSATWNVDALFSRLKELPWATS